MVQPINVNGRTFGQAGEGVIESTKEAVQYSFEPSDKLYDLVFQGKVSEPKAAGTHDVLYLSGGPAKVEWISFIWDLDGKVGAWGAKLNPDGIKFPWQVEK